MVVTLQAPHRGIGSTILGGGIGEVRSWLNLEVPLAYARTDPLVHLADEAADLLPPVAATMTAAAVADAVEVRVGGAWVAGTVGVSVPLAAAGALQPAAAVGTINLIAVLDVPLTDAGLVNAVQTMTEAKAQALAEGRVHACNHDGWATGTATDSLLIACPRPADHPGEPSDFAGPATPIGNDLAVAVHRCTTEGLARWRVRDAAPS